MNGTDEIAAIRKALAEAERARDEASARCDALIRQHRIEFQHQMRNIFAMIRSIGRRTAGEAESADEFFALFEGRLGAYSRAQATALRMGELGVDLETIVRDEMLEFGPPVAAQITIQGPSIHLKGKAAELAPLIFHEWACQVLTADAFERGEVSLAVQWQVTGRERPALVLTWTEDWKDPGAAPEPAQSSDWIAEAVHHQLDGEVSHDGPAERNRYTLTLDQSYFAVA